MSETTLEQERKYARQQIERFVRRFEPSYKKLAYYAALPLVLTPELLNYLRNQFLRSENENIPWVAEVDLLLSDICRPVGYEQYAMEPAVRAYLMEEMAEVLGKEKMEAVARLLIGYIKHLSQTNPYIRAEELRAQQWAAMVCLDDQRQKVVGQISQAYRDWIAAAESSGNPLLNRVEMERLSRITQELAPQLKDYPNLLAYAEVVRRLDGDPNQVSEELLNRSWQVQDVELRLPSALVPSREDGKSSTAQLPNRQTFQFEVAIIAFEDETETAPTIDLQPFEFEVATIRIQDIQDFIETIRQSVFEQTEHSLNEIEISILRGSLEEQSYREIAAAIGEDSKSIIESASKLWKLLSEVLKTKVTQSSLRKLFKERRLVIERTQKQAWGFSEDLGNGVRLEMVAIPEGIFMMGSLEDEIDRYGDESPQHEVSVKSFLMGKYPVTQAQWKAVAALPEINQKLDADPSRFKGENRPVERVLWLEAVEFCQRLSQLTGKPYRLPTEPEWEYACRAGTITPFQFGETITTDLGNYNGNYTYGAGIKGIYREKTTPVGSFGVANAFGLFDMHSNVWEWCADSWHDSYEGAPNDGTAWIDVDDNDNNSQFKRVLRGGSWDEYPWNCRSACRLKFDVGFRQDDDGFRVVCAVPWTL